MNKWHLLTLLVLSDCFISIRCQIAFSQLTKVGVIKAKNYRLKIKGPMTEQLMIINFIPNLSNMSNCTVRSLTNYKNLLTRVLKPVNDSITLMRSYITTRDNNLRFAGAIIGGIALGVATAAQITAGVALYNSINNAKAINQLKDAVKNSNKAIEMLQAAGAKTVVAINALQDQINMQIVPAVNQLGCQVAENSLSLKLNQYFSEISLIFGPNLRDPASETISIQTLSRAFNGDFESLLSSLKYDKQDLLDVMESDSIRGRIIDVDMVNYMMTLQIEYPSMIDISDATIQEFNLISYNDQGTEWVSVFPRRVLIRGNFLSNIDITGCSRTQTSYICLQDTSSPISLPLFSCATGDTSQCARERVVNSYVSRFALSDGVVFANCMHIPCMCKDPSHSIIQDTYSTNVMISEKYCREVFINGIYITLGTSQLNRSTFASNVELGKPVVTDPIDVGNQLANVKKDLDKAGDYLNKSNDILKRVNPSIVNTSTMVFLIIISALCIGWIIITCVWLVYLTKKSHEYEERSVRYVHDPAISSLSSLIPSV